MFTDAPVRELATGEADLDEDGWVALRELYDYVFDQVRARTPHQTPTRDLQMSGELYLARSRRRRIRAQPLPPDLQAAMIDRNPYSRLGAIDLLRERLGGDDLAVAVGAYDALFDIARTDIRHVAEKAAAARDEAAVQVLDPEMDLGTVAQGSPSTPRPVRLGGPPLARACTVESSPDRVRVIDGPDGLEATVETATAGNLRGSLTLKGHTGEVTISVQAEVTPSMQAKGWLRPLATRLRLPEPPAALLAALADAKRARARLDAAAPTTSSVGDAVTDDHAPSVPAAGRKPRNPIARGRGLATLAGVVVLILVVLLLGSGLFRVSRHRCGSAGAVIGA